MSELVEREHLRRYINDLETKLDWGPIADWGQRDFQQLSDLIEQQTHVVVSVTTLKRALGRIEYKGLPYTVTLNALAKVLGYKDWLDYKLGKVQEAQLPLPLKRDINKTPSRFWVGFLSGLLLATTLAGLLYWQVGFSTIYLRNTANTYQGPNLLTVSPYKYVDTLPAHFYFTYTIPPDYRDNLNIIRFEGRIDKPVRMLQPDSSGKGEVAITVPYAGLYDAKIFSNRSVLGKQVFMVPNKTWTAKIGKDENYRSVSTTRQNGLLMIDRNSAVFQRVDTTIDILTELLRVNEFNTTADDMVLECRIRCPSANINGHQPKITLRGRTDQMPFHITFDASETALNIYNQISDHIVNKENQRKNFQVKLGDWSYIKLVVKDKKANIYLNDRLVYSCNYTKPLGKLYELNLSARGLPELDVIRLKDGAGKLTYEDDF